MQNLFNRPTHGVTIHGLGVMMWLASLAALPGCDDGAAGGSASYPEANIVMQLPADWVQDGTGMHHQQGLADDHHGMVYLADLEADTLEAHVAGLVDVERGLVSRDSIEIDGRDAIELITESAYTLYEVYIRNGEQVVVVSFRTLPEAFDAQRDAFRAAAQSIRFQ